MNHATNSTAPALTHLSAGMCMLRDTAANIALEATMFGQARVSAKHAVMLFEGVNAMCGLLAGVLSAEVERLEAELPQANEPKPSMTQEQYINSWREQPDHAGIAELKEMGEQPARLPEGVFVMRGSADEIQSQVASLLSGIFGKQPPAAH